MSTTTSSPTSRLQSQTSGFFKLVQLSLTALLHFGFVGAAPLLVNSEDNDVGSSDELDPGQKWVFLSIAFALVVLGGAFAGLTIALMGQDEIYLQVIATSGEGSEKVNASKVLKLLKRGKHWVLVTLLVGNVVTNETLPIVLDRSIGGGYAAAITSTVLVIIFGEIVPQSICVRFGLPIGAWCANAVLVLMYVFAPITWPIAKLLDRLLGEDHGTTYKKAGLKTLVTLHKTMGETGSERLNQDEVTIISGVLDLKTKSVGSIMTPMNDVYTLPADAVLDEDTIDAIMNEGYSRIPVHDPKKRGDFVGMLLVKMLITYDPEDARKVSEFSLATLPETRPETSCLDILNFFQEGKSHMILVSDYPGQSYGALGVVTLEDVIEELIGEEIVDESDVFIDVHKAIRRMQPAPIHRYLRENKVVNGHTHNKFDDEDLIDVGDKDGEDESRPTSKAMNTPPRKRSSLTGTEITNNLSPKPTTFLMRRKSSNASPHSLGEGQRVQMRQYTPEMRQHLAHLGPSNAASKPKTTRVNTVMIKPGIASIPENSQVQDTSVTSPDRNKVITPTPTSAQAGIGQDLVEAGREASDGVQAVSSGYGTISSNQDPPSRGRSAPRDENESAASIRSPLSRQNNVDGATETTNPTEPPQASPVNEMRRTVSHSTIGSLPGSPTESPNSRRPLGRSTSNLSSRQRGDTRSGSITEHHIDAGGVRKLVLETTSSSSDDTTDGQSNEPGSASSDVRKRSSNTGQEEQSDGEGGIMPGDIVLDGEDGKKKQRRRKRGKKKSQKAAGDSSSQGQGQEDENTPLLLRGQNG